LFSVSVNSQAHHEATKDITTDSRGILLEKEHFEF
jgi:hypothetical protein